jgi:hypothetical protein
MKSVQYEGNEGRREHIARSAVFVACIDNAMFASQIIAPLAFAFSSCTFVSFPSTAFDFS